MSDAPQIIAPTGVDQAAWDAAIAAIRAYCGWHVAPVIAEAQAAIVHGHTVTLRSLRVVEVTGVSIAGTALADGNWTLSPESPTVFLANRPSYCRDVPVVASVEMSHGFDEFPAELLAVAQEAASRGTTGSFMSQVGQVRFSAGPSGTPGAASFMLGQDSSLGRYKLPPRP